MQYALPSTVRREKRRRVVFSALSVFGYVVFGAAVVLWFISEGWIR